MYLIIKHDFDSFENNIDSALTESIIGYVDNEIDAIKYMNNTFD